MTLLTHDQIITASDAELISTFRKIVAELNVRDIEASTAAKEAFVDEQVKKKRLEAEMQQGLVEAENILHREKIEAQAEANRQLFAQKKELAEKLSAIIGRCDLTLRPWCKGADSRIYININDKRRTTTACFFVTGNSFKAPGTLTWEKGFSKYQDATKELSALLAEYSGALSETINVEDITR